MKQVDFKVIENIGKIDGKVPKVAWDNDWYEFQKMEYNGIVFYCRSKCHMGRVYRIGEVSEKEITSRSYSLDLNAESWTQGKKEFLTKLKNIENEQ